MTATWALIIICSFSLLDCLILLIWYGSQLDQFKEATDRMNHFSELIIEYYKLDGKAVEDIQNQIGFVNDFVANIAKSNDFIREQYNLISKQYDTMRDATLGVLEQHKVLLGCWEKIEHKYSDTYEEFKYIKDQLDYIRGWCDTWEDEELETELIDTDTPKATDDTERLLGKVSAYGVLDIYNDAISNREHKWKESESPEIPEDQDYFNDSVYGDESEKEDEAGS